MKLYFPNASSYFCARMIDAIHENNVHEIVGEFKRRKIMPEEFVSAYKHLIQGISLSGILSISQMESLIEPIAQRAHYEFEHWPAFYK